MLEHILAYVIELLKLIMSNCFNKIFELKGLMFISITYAVILTVQLKFSRERKRGFQAGISKDIGGETRVVSRILKATNILFALTP
jgi:hypothetical protein